MSQEQRSAFRIHMPDGQKRATLRIEGRSFDVQLLDASATGVALACPLQCGIEIDNCCELQTSSGGGVIRIVRKEVFPDGILLGAVRTGDLVDKPRGLLGHATDLVCLPAQALARSDLSTKIGVIGVTVTLVFIGCVRILNWRHDVARASRQAQLSTTSVVEQTPSPAEVQEAIRRLEASLPATAELSESDQRAVRIFEQQKQLLLPDVSRRLRLTPTQESRIKRALAPTEDASSDHLSPHFWEAIRRSEMQILSILTPAQAKAWRQQNGT